MITKAKMVYLRRCLDNLEVKSFASYTRSIHWFKIIWKWFSTQLQRLFLKARHFTIPRFFFLQKNIWTSQWYPKQDQINHVGTLFAVQSIRWFRSNGSRLFQHQIVQSLGAAIATLCLSNSWKNSSGTKTRHTDT